MTKPIDANSESEPQLATELRAALIHSGNWVSDVRGEHAIQRIVNIFVRREASHQQLGVKIAEARATERELAAKEIEGYIGREWRLPREFQGLTVEEIVKRCVDHALTAQAQYQRNAAFAINNKETS